MAKKNQPDAAAGMPVGAPRVTSRMSLAALILGVLALPAGLLPAIGVLVAMVALVVAIIALVRANRNGTARNYPIAGLVLAIIAMGLSLITTKVALDVQAHCEGLDGDALTQCIKEYRQD